MEKLLLGLCFGGLLGVIVVFNILVWNDIAQGTTNMLIILPAILLIITDLMVLSIPIHWWLNS